MHINNNQLDLLKIKITELNKSSFGQNELLDLIKNIDHDFVPALSDRVDLEEWSFKLYKYATTIIAITAEKDKILGAISIYCNNTISKCAYIPFLGVRNEYRNNGIIIKLFNHIFLLLKDKQFKKVKIRTWNSSDAEKVYRKIGFIEQNIKNDRPNGNYSIYFEKCL